MNSESILENINILNEDKFLQDRIAQLNARYILFNTNESKDTFPNYSVKDDNMSLLAFQYLNLGCRLVEQEKILESSEALEKGSQILEYIYGSENNDISFRKYYVLISSLGYYSAFQYSKSFILIKKIENDTTISKLFSLFLQRRFNELQDYINTIIINDDYIKLSKSDDYDETPDRIYEIVIARSLSKIISYLNFGEAILLENAKTELTTLKEIAKSLENVDIWWVIRLILIIISGIEKASLWNVLRNNYGELPLLVKNFIYSHVFANSTKIHEFFTTQRSALNKVIGKNSGLIISMPTSSGKTRIAEVSILDTKVNNPDAKILFIAPYRSLAFEIENDLEKIFSPIGIVVSQLYGGSLFNKIDEKLIDDTDVIIATQEKAKALFRSDSEIIKSIKLVVLDEGHLLGANERLIRNELFIEELRYHIERNNGKFIVLSAVLPNPEDLSNWLTDSLDNIYKSDWRPSEERLGILEWTGKNVNLKWVSSDDERDSFNNRFIVAEKQPKKPRERIDKYIPSDKNEAVAATAIKLYSFGPVLIFVGVKRSVFTMAKSYLKVLGETEEFKWTNNNNWIAFKLACIEYDGADSKWLKYAKRGILCHNGDLPSDVRIPLERLMRTEKPRVIIATSTLGQGVNLGVSSVIFSTFYQASEPLEHSDFWNIAGRAGRAFVDQEGKILVALDNSKGNSRRERNRFRYNQNLLLKYFEKTNIQNAESGLLLLIKYLKYASTRFEGINFERFLELIAENDYTSFEKTESYIENLDLIDDTLLSLHQLGSSSEDPLDVSWVETFFKKSLAYIQLSKNEDESLKKEEVISFVKARIKGIVKSVGKNPLKWKTHIKSGIPLQSDLILEDKLSDIIEQLNQYVKEEDSTINAKVNLLSNIESIINIIPVLSDAYLESKDLIEIREKWISGESISEVKNLDRSQLIIRQHFSFKLPWVLNGIAKKLENINLEFFAELLHELAILSETGLPNLVAVKIYQAGIRSREAAIEISTVFHKDSWDKGINYYKNIIIEKAELYKILFSKTTGSWIDLFMNYNSQEVKIINNINPFRINELDSINRYVVLIPKTINRKEYLVSSDLRVIYPVANIEGFYLTEVVNLIGVFFRKREDNYWELIVLNPNIKVNTTS